MRWREARRREHWRAALIGMLLVPLLPALAPAAELRIAAVQEPGAIDPHGQAWGIGVGAHVFEGLVGRDAWSRPYPLLAEAWRRLDDRTWEFRLRRNVRFHDGAPFTARDVLHSFCRLAGRAADAPEAARSLASIEAVSAPDSHTVVIRTTVPDSLLPTELTLVLMGPAGPAAVAPTFHREGCRPPPGPDDSGAKNPGAKNPGAIGTGPFRLVERVTGDRIELARHDGYWGPPPAWRRVTFKWLPDEGRRVRALLAGEVDLIEQVTRPSLMESLTRDPQIGIVAQGPASQVVYLLLDAVTDRLPGAQGKGGNPLKDPRVRAAISKAIDRRALAERIMHGTARPAGQFLPPGRFGHDPELGVENQDTESARRLLAEAGHPDGFDLLLGAARDRINRDKVGEAIVAMLGVVGIRARLDLADDAALLDHGRRHGFGALVVGWGAPSGDMACQLRGILASPDARHGGVGAGNVVGYTNPELDRLLDEAPAAMADARREDLLRQASRIAAEDRVALPLYFEGLVWAFRKPLTFDPRADGATLAMGVGPGR